MKFTYSRYHTDGYECSSAGDRRFSALYARLLDGRIIEEAYQLDVKGFRSVSNDWRTGKGKLPLHISVEEAWQQYLGLWRQWATENTSDIEDLREKASAHGVLTDRYASSPVSQARALSIILNETAKDG